MGDAAETHKLFLEVEEEDEEERSGASTAHQQRALNTLSAQTHSARWTPAGRAPFCRVLTCHCVPPEQPVQPSPHDVRKGNRIWLLFCFSVAPPGLDGAWHCQRRPVIAHFRWGIFPFPPKSPPPLRKCAGIEVNSKSRFRIGRERPSWEYYDSASTYVMWFTVNCDWAPLFIRLA